MTLRSTLWITTAALGSLVGSASAQNFEAENAVTTHTYTRTYQFPPIGVSTMGGAQVSVLNVAADANSGAKASCTGTIRFANADGSQLGTGIPFTVGAGKIAIGVLPGTQATAAGGPSGGGPSGGPSGGGSNRAEISASVQLTLTWPAPAPCSLLMTLETFDNTGATHAVVTTAVETAQALGKSAR